MLRFIDGNFTKGEPILCRDFINVKVGEVVWAKAVSGQLDGPFQIMHRYEDTPTPNFVITDADEMGIYVGFPGGLNMDSKCGFNCVGVGQTNFFRAVHQDSQK